MFLEETLIYFVVAATSVLLVLFGIRRLGLQSSVLREAFHDVVQCTGAFLIFFGFNAAIGVGIAFLIRAVWRFFPLYAVADVGLIILSALQGFVFQIWLRRSRG